MVKWTFDAISNDSATNSKICPQMRAESIEDEHLLRTTRSKHDESFSNALDAFCNACFNVLRFCYHEPTIRIWRWKFPWRNRSRLPYESFLWIFDILCRRTNKKKFVSQMKKTFIFLSKDILRICTNLINSQSSMLECRTNTQRGQTRKKSKLIPK